MTIKLLVSGPVLDIYAFCQGNGSEVCEFLDGLDSADLAQVRYALDYLSQDGPSRNPCKFNNEGNGIYALKTKRVRLYGFFHGKKTFVLAVGFIKHGKGGRKVERRYCERAEKYRAQLM